MQIDFGNIALGNVVSLLALQFFDIEGLGRHFWRDLKSLTIGYHYFERGGCQVVPRAVDNSSLCNTHPIQTCPFAFPDSSNHPRQLAGGKFVPNPIAQARQCNAAE